MITTFIAKIAGATPVETFEGRDGAAVSKCVLVVETIEAVSQKLAVVIFGDLLPWAQQQGNVVEMSTYPSSHEHDGRWFSEIRALNIRYAKMPAENERRF